MPEGSGQGRVLGIARKGRPRAPMEVRDGVEVSVDGGIDGDARGRLRGRQVTLLAKEGWDAACRDLGREVPWTKRRANILIEGVAVAGEVGRTIRVGSVELVITGETDPCGRMEEQVAGLRAALTPDWRGGVTCNVAKGGSIEVGDGVGFVG